MTIVHKALGIIRHYDLYIYIYIYIGMYMVCLYMYMVIWLYVYRLVKEKTSF